MLNTMRVRGICREEGERERERERERRTERRVEEE